MDYCSYNTVRVLNFEGLKFCGQSMHKEFMGLYFLGSMEFLNNVQWRRHVSFPWIASNHEIHKKFEPLKTN